MEELMVVANVAIIFGVIYKLFELFACRRERMMLIEKLSSEDLTSGKKLNMKLPASFSPLRLGCLLLGLGLGLLVGYSLALVSQPEYFTEEVSHTVKETVSIIYAASVLLGGGLGSVVAFLIEVKCAGKQEE